MKALKIVSAGKAEVQDVAIPQLRPNHILVKITAVALNPTDWKHIDYMLSPGATVGCDFAGIVEELGTDVHTDLKKADRVAGVVHGSNAMDLESGCFADYALVKAHACFKIPSNLSNEEAATLGVALGTVGQALYQNLHLPLPGTPESAGWYLLVHGGSSATGSIAIQFAKLSGAKVLATSSPKNFAFLKSLGAEEVFDYSDPDCASKIFAYTNNSLHHVMDCIGGESSSKICSESISSAGGQIATIVGGTKYPREDVRVKWVLAYTAFGEAFRMGERNFPAIVEDKAFAAMFLRLSRRLLEEGKVKVHPPKVGEGGLEGVLDGLEEMRGGRVSGVKLVYRV